jgi:predicted membrane channel-forming protein YqfA (hemolysin III family)
MVNRPRSVSAALVFILLNALIWLALGLIIALHLHPALSDNPLVRGVMAGLSFGAAAILLELFFVLRRRSRLAWYLVLGFLALTCVLTIFDQVGLVDLVVLVINLVPIVLLIVGRGWFRARIPSKNSIE